MKTPDGHKYICKLSAYAPVDCEINFKVIVKF